MKVFNIYFLLLIISKNIRYCCVKFLLTRQHIKGSNLVGLIVTLSCIQSWKWAFKRNISGHLCKPVKAGTLIQTHPHSLSLSHLNLSHL